MHRSWNVLPLCPKVSSGMDSENSISKSYHLSLPHFCADVSFVPVRKYCALVHDQAQELTWWGLELHGEKSPSSSISISMTFSPRTTLIVIRGRATEINWLRGASWQWALPTDSTQVRMPQAHSQLSCSSVPSSWHLARKIFVQLALLLSTFHLDPWQGRTA
jgi:hypothetical protein